MRIDRRQFIASTALAVLSPPAARAAPGQDILLAASNAPKEEIARGGAPLAYGGAPPGQVLRARAGQDMTVRLTNGLGVPTNIDWHGLRVPAGFEAVPGLGGLGLGGPGLGAPGLGGPGLGAPGLGGSVTPPGGEARWTWRPADSGTAWLHPAYLPGWDDQTARGLAAVLIVEEPDPPPVEAERVLFIGDRPVTDTPAGAPAAGTDALVGTDAFVGTLALNGKAWPHTEVFAPGARLRLRIVNGSTRRALAAGFAGAPVFVIAIDGQPSELFRPLNDSVPLGPGARFDVMVDLPRTAGTAFTLGLRSAVAASGALTVPAFVARTEGAPVPERPPIHSLPPNPALPPVIRLEKSTRADINVTTSATEPHRWSVNNSSGTVLAPKPLFRVKRGTAVTLGFTNRAAVLTGFRLHGHVMRLLHARDDGWEPYWRDSVLVAPGLTVHVAFLADNPGKWLIDSPFFDQAVGGLRTWFEVV